jgi:hypothetical protein
VIPPAIRAVFDMLSRGARARACPTTDSHWKEILAFTDRFQLTLHLRGTPGLPPWLEEEIGVRLAKNLKRRERLRDRYVEVSHALNVAGIEFVLLKGFTHEAGFGIQPENRLQYDLDLLWRPEDRARATEALRQIGYVPHSGRSLSAEHSRPFVRPCNWKWRGDYFDPDIPIAIELHDSIWNPAEDRIRIDTSRFWNRQTILDWNGLQLPVLSEADRVGFAALHVLRHVVRNDARPAHAFELAQLLRIRSRDDSLWSQWLESRDDSQRTLESVAFRFAAEWFGIERVCLPFELPSKIEAWFNQFAWSPIANLFRPNKDAVWLHLALLGSWRDCASVICRRLTPFRFPHRNASFTQRLRYHAAAFAPALLRGLRWWWRTTVSTASQISDWKRGSV